MTKLERLAALIRDDGVDPDAMNAQQLQQYLEDLKVDMSGPRKRFEKCVAKAEAHSEDDSLLTLPDRLIAMAKRGERIPPQPYSLHHDQKPGLCNHKRGWRTIVCNGDEDVVECPLCGEQRVMPCNFDENLD